MEDKVIILRLTQYKESDAIVTAISSNGYVSFSARGIMKINAHNGALIQPFNEVVVDLTEGKAGNVLKTASTIFTADASLNHLEKMSALFLLGEITLAIIKEEEDAKKIFPFLEKAIHNIEKFDELSLVMLYLATAIKVAGFGPEVDQCVICGSKRKIVGFSFEEGGFICQNCAYESQIEQRSTHLLNMYRYAFKISPDDICRVSFEAKDNLLILSELNQYLSDSLGIKLKKYNDFISILRV
ncbi:MAG TPA: DNA repair protein RecO [Bacilli bacterium]|nr:DNA repair protein RecO [Bacilli bacterium]